MKYLKSFLKALVKVVLIFAIIIGIIVVLMNKFFYKTKTPITSQEFYNMMISQDVSVVETSDDLEEYGVSLEKCFEAHHSNYEMLFFELTSEKDAETLFDVYKEEIKSIRKSGGGGSLLDKGGNYEIYRSHDSDFCYRIYRVENTLLYVKCDADSLKDVENLIEKIGYEIESSNNYTFDKTAFYD